ncbi:MAG: zinc-ribbon domain-containing protein, partial [Microvirga sp.]
MNCLRCAQPSPDNARFCSQCGAPLVLDAPVSESFSTEPESTEEFKP